jgi:gluconolactonase
MMKSLLLLLYLLLPVALFAQAPVEKYPVDSASVEHLGVPKGELIKLSFENSKIFPGTWREYWIYVPAQYDPAKPACVYVNQDGVQNKAPTVFDNLINSKEMPVTIGVFVNPGQVRAADEKTALNRYNRSLEYDGLGDAYARFILTELLPDVEKHKTSNGRPIRLSQNGNDRAIGGASSGAIAAFTAAWERPDAFSRVFSAIGTYTGLRGGDRYSSLLRKYEAKPIRIFLQDGANDLNIYGGDWYKANEMMERALTFAGYQVKHVWGEGGHNGSQATSLFPDAMRWLWKDYPQPVTTAPSKNPMLGDMIVPGEGWELVGQGYGFTEGVAANAAGEVFYQDIPNAKTYKVGLDGKLTVLKIDSKRASGTAFAADGKRYTAAGGTKQVLAYAENDRVTVVADSINGNDLVVAKNGNIYVTEPYGAEKPGKLYLIKPDGKKLLVDEGIKFPNGLAFTPDQTQLYVTESASHWVWLYSILPDGTLANKQRYGYLYVPDVAENAWPDGLKCDTAGRIYVATRMGIQVLDQAGRVNAILPVPTGQPSNLCFGGANFDVLYVTSVDKVYRRKLKVRGVNTFEAPLKPAKPRL